jgi:type VI protein secretion system component Hcp
MNMDNVSNNEATELTLEDLDAVTGGDAKTEPTESLSLNFTKVQFTYVQQH